MKDLKIERKRNNPRVCFIPNIRRGIWWKSLNLVGRLAEDVDSVRSSSLERLNGAVRCARRLSVRPSLTELLTDMTDHFHVLSVIWVRTPEHGYFLSFRRRHLRRRVGAVADSASLGIYCCNCLRNSFIQTKSKEHTLFRGSISTHYSYTVH